MQYQTTNGSLLAVFYLFLKLIMQGIEFETEKQ